MCSSVHTLVSSKAWKAVIHGLLFHCVPVFPLEIADVVTDQGTCILPLQSFQIIGRNRLIQNLRDISKSFQTLGDQKKLRAFFFPEGSRGRYSDRLF